MCQDLDAGARAEPPPTHVIVCSPVSRALRTIGKAFTDTLATGEVPVVVTHLGAECLYHSSDVGVLQSVSEAKFPRFDFSGLPSGPWWYEGGQTGENGGLGGGVGVGGGKIEKEPGLEFLQRMGQFRDFLKKRPEKHIAYVGHWAVLYTLTGYDFDNCELVTTNLDVIVDPGYLDPNFT